MVSALWLAATADRERTVGALRAGFVEGRLTQDELDGRVAQAYAARTYADLWALTADLPTGALPYPALYPQDAAFLQGYGPQPGPAVSPDAAAASSWQSGAALLVLALVIFTLAALVTAIVTAYGQPGMVAPVQQPGVLMPGEQPGMIEPFHVILIPDVTHRIKA